MSREIQNLPPELVQIILSELDYKEAFKLCQTNRQLLPYCRHWNLVFPLKYPQYNWKNLTHKEAIDIEHILKTPSDSSLIEASQKEYLNVVKYLIEEQNIDPHNNEVLIEAIQGGCIINRCPLQFLLVT
jgi:hypothetical protein